MSKTLLKLTGNDYEQRTSFIMNDTNSTYYPSINVCYGPYASVTEATTDATNVFGGIDNVPDGLVCLVYSDSDYEKTTLDRYMWFKGHYTQDTNGGDGGSKTYNVLSNYTFNISNPRIIVPVTSDKKSTPAALKAASTTSIKITNGSNTVEIDEGTTNYFSLITTDGNASSVYKIVYDGVTEGAYMYHLEFIEASTAGISNSDTELLYSATNSSMFVCFNLSGNGASYTVAQDITIDVSGIAYLIDASDAVLKVNENNIIEPVTIDIDEFNTLMNISDTITKDADLSIKYLHNGTWYDVSYTPDDVTGLIILDEKMSVTIAGTTYTFGDLAAGTGDNVLKHGESILLKINKNNIIDYRTIIINVASAYTGVFTSSYAFSLNKYSFQVPKSYKETKNKEYLKNATIIKASYTNSNDLTEDAKITGVSISGDTNAKSVLVNIDNPFSSYAYLDEAYSDLTINLELLSKDGLHVGKASANMSFSDLNYYYTLLCSSPIVPIGTDGFPINNNIALSIQKIEDDATTTYTGSDNLPSSLAIKKNGQTISNLIDSITSSQENNSYITYTLYETISDVEYPRCTAKVYFVLSGANGVSADCINLDNDTIVIDDDISTNDLKNISLTAASAANDTDITYDWTVDVLPITSGINLNEYLGDVDGWTKSVSSSNTNGISYTYSDSGSGNHSTCLFYLNSIKSFDGVSLSATIIYTATDHDSETNAVYATKKLSFRVMDIGTTYKLSLTPNTVPLDSTGTTNLLNSGTTQLITGSIVAYGSSETLSVVPTGDLVFKSKNGTVITTSNYSSTTPKYFTFVENVSNILSGSSLYYLCYKNVVVDSETIGYTKQGIQGTSPGSILITNDSVVLDDDSTSPIIKETTENVCEFYVGNSKIEKDVTWTLSVSGDISSKFKILYSLDGTTPIKEYTDPITTEKGNIITTALILSTGSKAGAASQGYVKYVATYTDESETTYSSTKYLTVRIANISEGSSYRLIAYPNVLQVNTVGTISSPTVTCYLQEITETKPNPITPGTSGYLFDYSYIGLPTSFGSILNKTLTFTYKNSSSGINIQVSKTNAYNEANGTYYRCSASEISGGYLALLKIIYSSGDIRYTGLKTTHDVNECYNFILNTLNMRISWIHPNGYTLSSGILDGTFYLLDINGSTYLLVNDGTLDQLSDINGGTLEISLWLESDLTQSPTVLDVETIGFALLGTAGASSGYSLSIDNDNCIIDDDTDEDGIKISSEVNVSLYKDGVLQTVNSSSISTKLTFYNEKGVKLTDTGKTTTTSDDLLFVWDSTSNYLKFTDLYRNTKEAESDTTPVKLNLGYGYVDFTYTVDAGTKVSKRMNFYVKDFSQGEIYRMTVSPNTLYKSADGISEAKDLTISVTYRLKKKTYTDCVLSETTSTNSYSNGDLVLEVLYPEPASDTDKTRNGWLTFNNDNTATLKILSSRFTNNDPYIINLYIAVGGSGTLNNSSLVLIDSESIDFSKEGAASTTPGTTLRYRGEYLKKNTYLYNEYDPNNAEDTLRYTDIVKSEEGTYYQTIKPVPINTAPPNTSYWKEASEYDLLIANEVLVKDSDGKITGGLVGGFSENDDIVLWAGNTTNPSDDTSDPTTSAADANFYVTNSGKVVAKDFNAVNGNMTMSIDSGAVLFKYNNDTKAYFAYDQTEQTVLLYILKDGVWKHIDLSKMIGGNSGTIVYKLKDSNTVTISTFNSGTVISDIYNSGINLYCNPSNELFYLDNSYTKLAEDGYYLLDTRGTASSAFRLYNASNPAFIVETYDYPIVCLYNGKSYNILKTTPYGPSKTLTPSGVIRVYKEVVSESSKFYANNSYNKYVTGYSSTSDFTTIMQLSGSTSSTYTNEYTISLSGNSVTAMKSLYKLISDGATSGILLNLILQV